MDQFTAHLERGWDLVQKGDPRGAELSARRAIELDGQSPEAYNLLGFVAALQGEFDDAVEHYRQAIALDDTYFEAMLNAAEVYIHPLADFDEALNLCHQAVELAETTDETVDALLLAFDALLGKGDLAEAKVLCGRFPDGPFENPTHAFLVGRAHYEVGNLDASAPLIEEAARQTPSNPEALYYHGLVMDDRGDSRGATAAFLKSRTVDLAAPPPSWALSSDAFLTAVQRVVEALGEDYKKWLLADELYVSDLPGVELIVDGVDPRAVVLLEPIGDAGPDGRPLARSFIYQRNVERIAGSLEYLEAELKSAFEREVAATCFEAPPPDGTARH
jgi:Flp pilus assembly protein TadD